MRAGTDSLAVDWVCVTVRTFLAGVTDAGIVQVAQQTCPALWTLAEEGGHAIVAGGPQVAGSAGAVVDILAAVVARPAIDAHAVVASVGVMAGTPILTGIGHELAFIYILHTELACPFRWALAVVCVHTIHTGASVLALVFRTVVNVLVTVLTSKTWQAGAVVGGISSLPAGSPVLAGRGVAWHVRDLAVLSNVLLLALAPVGAKLVDALASVLAQGGAQGALVLVLLAGRAVESRGAAADVVRFKRGALAAVGARVGGARISLLTRLT